MKEAARIVVEDCLGVKKLEQMKRQHHLEVPWRMKR